MSASIIIPVKGRSSELSRLLNSIAEQDCAERIEVIVVDNPTSANRSWLQSTSYPFRLSYRLVSEGNRGLARNVGASSACSEELLFVDSDVTFRQHAVSHMLQQVRENDRAIVMPEVRFPDASELNLATRFYDVASYFRLYSARANQGRLGFRDFVSCCFAVSKKLFEEVGLFSTEFVHYGYEDVEFAWRAARAGAEFELTSTRVYHLNPWNPHKVLARSISLGRSAVQMTRLHPGFEDELRLGVDDVRTGALFYPADFDAAARIRSLSSLERQWAQLRRSESKKFGASREVVTAARRSYAELARYGRFVGINEELHGRAGNT